MNKHILPAVCLIAASLLVLAACGQTNETNGNDKTPASSGSSALPAESQQPSPAAEPSQEELESQILVVLDQTEMPIETGGLTFGFKHIPEGYALHDMRWQGEGDPVTSTWEEAVEKGQNGEEGFYISGDGQYSGFLYPNARKGEQGEISFSFVNDAGKKLTWKKESTLQ